eukprot:gene4795-8381_t
MSNPHETRDRKPPKYLLENYDLTDLKYKIVDEEEVKIEKKKVTKQNKTTKKKGTKKSKTTSILEGDDIIDDLPEYIWQYEDNGFNNYDVEASEVVEEVYQQWLKNPGDFDVRSKNDSNER